jgi:hypothetical protein
MKDEMSAFCLFCGSREGRSGRERKRTASFSFHPGACESKGAEEPCSPFMFRSSSCPITLGSLPCRFEPEAERNRLQYIAKHQEREATGKDAELEEGSRQ